MSNTNIYSENTWLRIYCAQQTTRAWVIREIPPLTSCNGWTGTGYIIIDPLTGDGAYMISGGMSGGMLRAAIWIITALLMLAIIAAICITSAGTGCVVSILLLPFYSAFQAWVSTVASNDIKHVVCNMAAAALLAFIFNDVSRIMSMLIGAIEAAFDPCLELID